MIKDILQEKEPIAYRCLKNALANDKIAHSYLLTGVYNPLKIETAYLLAESIIEDKHDFAREECSTCKRIRNNEYFDVIFVDGYKESIKKDDIENILEEFSRTSLESSGKKIYILANINNSSAKVLNMILKFMEEPSNSDTYGILISDNKDTLLPTIVSRCQEVPFMTRDFSYLIKEYEEHGFDYIDAYLLANILHEYNKDFDLNDPYYLNGKEYVYKTIANLDNKEYIPILFSNEFYPCFKDRDDFKKCSDYYLDIMIKMLEDAMENVETSDKEYNQYLAILKNHNLYKLFTIFTNAKDKVLVNAQRNLLFDSISFEIISYI